MARPNLVGEPGELPIVSVKMPKSMVDKAALKDACSQLLQGHAVNRIVGPNKTITAERVRDWCAKHRS